MVDDARLRGLMSRAEAEGADGGTPAGPDVVRLLVVLATAAGSLDVVCLTQLGSVFASVITGNLVSLGNAVATGDGTGVLRAGLTVSAYALGVGAGSLVIGSREGPWSRRSSALTVLELALLVGVLAGWRAVGGRPSAAAALLLLGASATAMGVQSVVTMSSGVRAASTTYFTGTLTSLVRGLVVGSGRPAAPDVVRLAALLAGALAGAALLRVAPLWAPALPAVLVGGVVLFALLQSRRPKEGS